MLDVSKYYHNSNIMMLRHVVYSNKNQWLYDIPLIELNGNEYNLNDGRFRNFTKDEQDYSITIDNNNIKAVGYYDEFRYKMVQMVEWVAQHSDEAWSFYLMAKSVGNVQITFSFKSASTAVLFKLVWWI